MCRLVTSIRTRIAFSGTLVFFSIYEVRRVFKIRLLFFCYRLREFLYKVVRKVCMCLERYTLSYCGVRAVIKDFKA